MDIIGHQKQLNILKRSLEKNSVSQAYLFHGPESVGKFTVALDFVKKLTGGREGLDADLSIVAPERETEKNTVRIKDIKIDPIRDLQHWLSLAPAQGGKRVAIIDDADRLNIMAQNALLKTLEEPNPDCVIILIVQNIQKILPTIFSRCHKINFGTVSDSKLEEQIIKEKKDKQELVFWSLGRPGILIKLLNDPAELAKRQAILGDLNQLFEQNIDARFSLAEKKAKDIENTMSEMNLWIMILREALLGNSLQVKKNPGEKIKLIEKISESLEIMKGTNANARLVLENLFLNF